MIFSGRIHVQECCKDTYDNIRKHDQWERMLGSVVQHLEYHWLLTHAVAISAMKKKIITENGQLPIQN